MNPISASSSPRALTSAAPRRIDGVQDRYIEFAKLTLPKAVSFEGLRVVIDCANGAAYKRCAWGTVGNGCGRHPDRR